MRNTRKLTYSIIVSFVVCLFIIGSANGAWPSASKINAVYLGKPSTIDGLGAAALSASDAFNLDQKIDDGYPTTGNFRSIESSEANSAQCISGPSNYNINLSGLVCVSGWAVN